MKKMRMLLCISILATNVAYADIATTLESIDKEMKNLEIKEQQKFKIEETAAKQATIRYTNYVEYEATVTTKIAELESSMEQSFFPSEQKTILNSYKATSKELKQAIATEGQRIEEFNQLKQILGY